MGKRRQFKVHVVDAFEVGTRGGLMVLRVGSTLHGSRPVNVVIPPATGAEWIPILHRSALEAEEDYWDIIMPLVHQVGPEATREEVGAHIERWLLDRDWLALIARTPDDDAPFVLNHAGHVGLALAPPATTEPVLLVLDPQQLHRVHGALRDAAIAAAATAAWMAPQPVLQRVAEAHQFLAVQPWQPAARVPHMPAADADASVLRAWAEFLARTPVEPTGVALPPEGASE